MTKKLIYIYAFLLCLVCVLSAQEKEVRLKIVQTNDVHGNYFPYNFITQQEWGESLTRVHALAQKNREVCGENLILLDNGDILQEQPSTCYYNYIGMVTPHVCVEMMDFMEYDAGSMGSHDVETGYPVFDRWIGECSFPVLRADIVETVTDRTRLPPHQVLERNGVEIMILGMITPATPVRLSGSL